MVLDLLLNCFFWEIESITWIRSRILLSLAFGDLVSCTALTRFRQRWSGRVLWSRQRWLVRFWDFAESVVIPLFHSLWPLCLDCQLLLVTNQLLYLTILINSVDIEGVLILGLDRLGFQSDQWCLFKLFAKCLIPELLDDFAGAIRALVRLHSSICSACFILGYTGSLLEQRCTSLTHFGLVASIDCYNIFLDVEGIRRKQLLSLFASGALSCILIVIHFTASVNASSDTVRILELHWVMLLVIKFFSDHFVRQVHIYLRFHNLI